MSPVLVQNVFMGLFMKRKRKNLMCATLGVRDRFHFHFIVLIVSQPLLALFSLEIQEGL